MQAANETEMRHLLLRKWRYASSKAEMEICKQQSGIEMRHLPVITIKMRHLPAAFIVKIVGATGLADLSVMGVRQTFFSNTLQFALKFFFGSIERYLSDQYISVKIVYLA